jgi:hypothetical protein
MKKIFVILSFLILSGCQTTGGMEGIDKDWDVGFYDNCGLPKDTLKTIEEDGNKFLRFQLKNMQKGGCNSDRKRRHGAPYWERAELKQSAYLHKGSVYEIKFKVRFVEGFNGNRENFFQIHQYNKNCPRGPLIMFKFSEGTIYGLWTLKISEVLGKWMDFNIILDLINGSYTVKIDDKKFLENAGLRYNFKGCGRPHIKFGIYRPGNKYTPIETSVIDFDDMKVKKLNP